MTGGHRLCLLAEGHPPRVIVFARGHDKGRTVGCSSVSRLPPLPREPRALAAVLRKRGLFEPSDRSRTAVKLPRS